MTCDCYLRTDAFCLACRADYELTFPMNGGPEALAALVARGRAPCAAAEGQG